MPEKKHWGCVKKNCGFTFSIRRHGCMTCAYSRILKPAATESPAPSGQAGLALLSCPWDKYIKESDGNFKDFGAWERWLNELDDAILEDMEIELRSSLYGIMIDMLKAT